MIRWVILHESQTDGDHSIAAVWGDSPLKPPFIIYNEMFLKERTFIGIWLVMISRREADRPSDSSILGLWIWIQLQMSDFSLNTIMMWGMSGLNEYSHVCVFLCYWRPQFCCPAPVKLSAAPRPETSALISAADSTWQTQTTCHSHITRQNLFAQLSENKSDIFVIVSCQHLKG